MPAMRCPTCDVNWPRTTNVCPACKHGTAYQHYAIPVDAEEIPDVVAELNRARGEKRLDAWLAKESPRDKRKRQEADAEARYIRAADLALIVYGDDVEEAEREWRRLRGVAEAG